VATTGGGLGCGKGPGDGEGDVRGEEPQQKMGKKGGRPGPFSPGTPGKDNEGTDPSDQIGSGRGELVVDAGTRGGNGWFKTICAGSEGEVGSAGTSEMRFPQRVRAKCWPSLRIISPLCKVTFFFVQ